jgi:hypothetical protein
VTVRRLRLRGALAALVVAATACTGPRAPLNIDVGAVPTDILLGAKVRAVAAPPIPPVLLTPPVPGAAPTSLLPIEVLPPQTGTSVTTAVEPPPPACPAGDPLQTPTLQAGGDIVETPKVATYTYRTSGSFEIGGANAQKGVLPPTSVRSVKVPAWNATRTAFEFDMEVKTAGQTTISHYRVVPATGNVANPHPTIPKNQVGDPAPTIPPQTAPAARAGGPTSPGVYLISVRQPSGAAVASSVRTFNGGNGMLLVELPISPHDHLDSTATTGDATLRYSSTVGKDVAGQYQPHQRVDACGTLLDAWTVVIAGHVTQGASGDGTSIDFTATYAIGTQFGGLILEDHEVFDNADDSSAPVHRESHAVINNVPEPGP